MIPPSPCERKILALDLLFEFSDKVNLIRFSFMSIQFLLLEYGYMFQLMGVLPCSNRNLFALEKCLQPKNPRFAESGEG